MALRLPDKWIWDFWLAQDDSDYHIFYLQAPRSLQVERLRHFNVSVGHAVSQDLRNWEVLPDAFAPGPDGAWDDMATWTGSIIKHDDLWYFFYTAVNHAEAGKVQRIGLATSRDLTTWERHVDNPVIEADARFYEQLDLTIWHDQAWRDPWVFYHPPTDDFHAYITGRWAYGRPDERGVIAHARSKDLLTWEVLPPVTQPGEFGQMEVPQLVEIEGWYYLLFCAMSDVISQSRLNRVGAESGTHYLMSDNPFGPFHYPDDKFMVGDEIGSLYAGKLVQGPGGDWLFLAWRNFAPNGEFIGELDDPHPVQIKADGRLVIG